jgi:hypothetical protein
MDVEDSVKIITKIMAINREEEGKSNKKQHTERAHW